MNYTQEEHDFVNGVIERLRQVREVLLEGYAYCLVLKPGDRSKPEEFLAQNLEWERAKAEQEVLQNDIKARNPDKSVWTLDYIDLRLEQRTKEQIDEAIKKVGADPETFVINKKGQVVMLGYDELVNLYRQRNGAAPSQIEG